MKAWVLEDIGKFMLKDVPKPDAADGNVIVRVRAAGICGSDIQRVYENGAHRMPLIIGHEFSGQVESVGRYVSEDWIGKRVGIFPLIPCRKCPACLSKKYEMCAQYSYLGSRVDGGFAEYVSVPTWNLMELPDEMSFEQAAMLEPMAVAVHAMRRVDISRKASVAVCGLGTIGQLLLMFLLESGIENVYAIGSKASQRKTVTALGLPDENFCDSSVTDVKDFIDRKTEHQGVEIFFECVGKNETVAQAIDLTAAGGQICLVGNPYSDMRLDRDIYWKILRRQLRITGTWNSSYLGEMDEDALYDDWHYVTDRLKAGRLKPEELITHRLSMEQLDTGFEIMRDKKEPYIKIMTLFAGGIIL